MNILVTLVAEYTITWGDLGKASDCWSSRLVDPMDNGSHFEGFSRTRMCSPDVAQPFANVSKVVLCGRRNAFATFSEDVFQFSWQAQHFGDLYRYVAWQAQHFRHVVLRVFCKSHCQGCVKWWQRANSVAGVEFCEMWWKVREASHETLILRSQILRFMRKFAGKRQFCSYKVWKSEEVSHEMLLRNLSFSRASKLVVVSFCVAEVALLTFSRVCKRVENRFCVTGAILLQGLQQMSCIFRGSGSTLETSMVILRGSCRNSDVSRCVLYTLHSRLYTPHFTFQTLHSTPYFTLYTWHSTLYTPHSTVHTPHFTLHTPHFTLYTPHSTLYTLHSTLHTLHFTLHTAHSTLYALHPTLHTAHCTLHISHFILYTPHSTLYTLHSTHYTLHSTLHTPHSTLYTPHTTLHTSHSTLCIPHCALHTLHSTLHAPHFTLHTLYFTLHTLHSTLYTPHFTLYTPHFTLHFALHPLRHSTVYSALVR